MSFIAYLMSCCQYSKGVNVIKNVSFKTYITDSHEVVFLTRFYFPRGNTLYRLTHDTFLPKSFANDRIIMIPT